eukprot:GEMP01018700.1.p1 GENE.GEMP01018700.1~~GEMP01018700.1.p1  ORF type:complete len:778 (-),score=183.43 GEMP01018700.1:398-2710(-)
MVSVHPSWRRTTDSRFVALAGSFTRDFAAASLVPHRTLTRPRTCAAFSPCRHAAVSTSSVVSRWENKLTRGTLQDIQRRCYASSSTPRPPTMAKTNWEDALHALRTQSAPTLRHVTVAISACASAHQWTLALQLLTDMPQHYSLRPTTITYNAAMNACAKAAQWTRALELLALMHQYGENAAPDVVSYSTALNACAKAGQWQCALELFDSMRGCGIRPNAIAYNACISALAKCEHGVQWQSALSMLHSMDPSLRTVVSYSAAISACEKAGEWVAAVRLLDTMKAENVAPNAIAYSATISACARAAEWSVALNIFDSMLSEKVKKDVIVFNAAITACANAAMWTRALGLMRRMERMKIHADTISYNAAIFACGNAGEWRLAKQLLHTMEENAHTNKKVAPTIRSYNAAISACEKRRKWQQALDLFARICQNAHSTDGSRVRPNVITYNSTISACEKAGKWQHALNLLEHMNTVAVAPDVISYSAAMSACVPAGKWHEALVVLARMLNDAHVVPNAHAFSAAIGACVGNEQWEIALRLLAQMKEVGCVPDAITYTEAWKACEGEARAMIQNEVYDACIQWTRGSNPAFMKGPHDAVQLLLTLGCDAPEEFTAKVRDCVFDRTVAALREGNVESLHRFGLPNLGPFTQEALDVLGISKFDATDARQKVAASGAPSKSDDVRAQEVVAHVKAGDVDRVVKYGPTSLSRVLPSVFLRHDRSPHSERQALLQVIGAEGPVELYVTHRPCVSCIAAMVSFQSEHGNLAVAFDELDGE